MITREWSLADTLAILNDAQIETEDTWLEYSENFFAHGLQNQRRNDEEMQRILGNLENSARVGNECAGAVLGFAVLHTFTRVQVTEDALSYLTRAAKQHVRGAAAELCRWYAERLLKRDWKRFEDADVGLDDCYVASKKFPRVTFPQDDTECTARLFEAAAQAIEDFGMDEVHLPVISILAAFGDITPAEIAPLEMTILRKAASQADDSMMDYAVMRVLDDDAAESHKAAIKILELGVKQGVPKALCFLGSFLLEGLDGLVKKDVAKGFGYCQRAADAGNAQAKYALSLCYRDGLGTAVDAAKARALLEESLREKDPRALVDFGRQLIDTAEGPEKAHAIKQGCQLIRTAAEEMDFMPAWRAMLEYHEKGVGPFKTNKFRRAAKDALARHGGRRDPAPQHGEKA